ncbi:MAG: hypothetical protein WDZ85_01945 [Candidatus Paceibacterota bacterium]
MNNTKILLFVLLIILAASAGLAYWQLLDSFGRQNLPANQSPALVSITIDRPNLIIEGDFLDRVELLAFLAGTESAGEPVVLGEAQLTGENRWIFPIPDRPLAARRITAQGYADGRLVGEISLGVSGPNEIYRALWSEGDSILLTLNPGQTGSFENLQIKFREVLTDNRCPADSQCVPPGEFSLLVTLLSEREEEEVVLFHDSDPYAFTDYLVSLIDIKPAFESDREISNYQITFAVSKINQP